MNKLFVIRKYVLAPSIAEALRREKSTPVTEIFIDADWQKEQNNRAESSLGFLGKVS